jgi:DNA-directed RNA polymerase subunit RPC12/RpoP
MQEVTYELECDDCGAEYTIIQTVPEHVNEDQPIYCPMCGSEVDISNIDEEDDLDMDPDHDDLYSDLD